MGLIKKLINRLRDATRKRYRPTISIGLLVATGISVTVATAPIEHVPSTPLTREDPPNDDVTSNPQGNNHDVLPGDSNAFRNTVIPTCTPGHLPGAHDRELLSNVTEGHSLPVEIIDATISSSPRLILEDGANEHNEHVSTGDDRSEPDDTDSILMRWENVEPLHFGRHTFTIKCQIGQGSFGFVWQAFDENQDEVAIKVLHKQKYFLQSVQLNPDARLVNLACAYTVTREVTALKRVTKSGCPFLTPLLCSFADDQNVYLVMRMYSTSLRDFVGRRVDLYPRKMYGLNLYLTRLWAAEILLGIQAMHNVGIMHRDIKSDNILIAPAGHVAIGDFGLAVLAQCGFPLQNLESFDCCGTPGYFAPEQHQHRSANGYNYKVDLYAYGIVLLEMFVGAPWYSAIENYDPNNCLPYDPRIRMVIARVYNKDARLLISQLLSEDPNSRPEAEQIKQFPFFKGLDWNAVAHRLYTPHFTPCASKLKSRNATSGIYSFRRICSSTVRSCAQELIDCSAEANEGLGALNVNFVCPDAQWSDLLHGVTCTWPRPRHTDEGMEQCQCRYYRFPLMRIHNHF